MAGTEQQTYQEQTEARTRLKQEKEEILRIWSDHLREQVPAVRELDADTLRNNLAQLLDEIADVLVESIGKDAYSYAHLPTAKEHAKQRTEIETYSLEQVIMEYHLLRKAIIEVLEQGTPLPQGIASVINDGIDRAMQDAAVYFAETHQEICRAHEERQQRLTQEAEALREVDRAKDDYLAVLAHELRTPLSTIRNALHVLGQLELGDERAFRQINTATRQTTTLCRIMEDLLDISRIARGKLELRREPLDLCRVVSEATQSVRPLVESRGHQLEVQLASPSPWVEADAVRLEQVLTNLLTNAAKYTEHGGHIWISVRAEQSYGVVSVKDTGIGIPAEKLPHVFDLFNQLGLTSEHSQGGLGIGLALSHRIVELHGGRIEATSAGPGHGSEFKVWLPEVPQQR